LDEIKAFVRDMIVDKPIPGWLFQLLDELHEVEADVTISNVRLREFPGVLQNLWRSTHDSSTSSDVLHSVSSG
jgi:hypothetical protein